MLTQASADALEALALAIFNPEITPSPDPALGNKWGKGTGLIGPDAATDAHLAALIAEPMLAIDGRTLALGFRYTLNVTNALQLRPKHWYMNLIESDGSGYGWPANTEMVYHSAPGVPEPIDADSWGGTIGLATCGCICNAWAKIIRMWLAGSYPLAVTQPTP